MILLTMIIFKLGENILKLGDIFFQLCILKLAEKQHFGNEYTLVGDGFFFQYLYGEHIFQ